MFDALARLAQRHRGLVVIFAVLAFGAAGALGSGVADKLDPYGADDPESESVIAREQIEDAGYRGASVVVLIEDVNVETAAGRDRVTMVAEEVRKDDDVAGVTGYLETGSPNFLSSKGDAT